MTEQQLDLWAERRGELAVLIGQLQPESVACLFLPGLER